MFLMGRKRNEDKQQSEAVFHYKGEQKMPAEKLPGNYNPHWSERDEQTRPRKLFSMNNSYGNVSVAANRKREMTLAVSEKRRHNSETLDNDHKKLNGERRRSVVNPLGWAYTNSSSPADSAFVFKTKNIQPAKRVLAQINKYLVKNRQNVLETTLPFLSLARDKKILQELINKTGGARKGDQDIFGLEDEKERLTRAILHKEQAQMQFLKRLHLSLKKAKVLTDTKRTEWLKTAIITDSMGTPEEPPGEGKDGLIEGLIDGVQKKTQAEKNKKS